MKPYRNKDEKHMQALLQEDKAVYTTAKGEEEKLREAIYRSDMEKFRLFTRMLRVNAMYKRAVVTHKL